VAVAAVIGFTHGGLGAIEEIEGGKLQMAVPPVICGW
jgi:hypothetical protein